MLYFIKKKLLAGSLQLFRQFKFLFTVFAIFTSYCAHATVSIVYTSNQPDILLKKQVAHFPELGTLLKEMRSKNSNVLFLHGGDSFSPSAISLFDNATNIVALANLMNVSLYSVGKRELTYDVDILSLRTLEAQFPIVSSNVIDNRNGEEVEGLFSNYEFNLDGINISVASLINPRALITYAPKFADIKKTQNILPMIVEQQKNADLKILMTDLKKPEISKIAKMYHFDIIFSANDGKDEVFTEGNTQVVYAGGQDGDTVIIDFNKKAQPSLSAKVVDLSKYLPDSDIVNFINQYRTRLGKLFNEKIAVANDHFTTKKEIIRTRETALANIFVDALRDNAETDIAIINSGSIRSSENYPKGYNFTREDIQQELPFGGYFVVVEVTGKEIFAMMENSVSRIEYIDGRFMNISGMTISYDSKAIPGSRVKSIKIDGKTLDLDKTYTLAMQNFFLKGADEYSMLKDKKPLNNLFSKRRIWHIVTDYFIKLKTIDKPALNRLIDVSK